MLEEKILNSDCKDIYLKIKDKLLNEYSLVIDCAESYIAFDTSNYNFHNFWIVLEEDEYKFYYRKLHKLERYNNIDFIKLDDTNFKEISDIILNIFSNKELYNKKIIQYLNDISDIDDKSLFSWFVDESNNNGFECYRDYTFTTKRIVFKFYNCNSKFNYYLDYTNKTFLIIFADNNKPIGVRNKNCKVYELSIDNKEEIKLLLKKFKDGEIPCDEDGIHKNFRYYYNLIKENYNNRKDRIEGFYITFNSIENKLYLCDKYFLNIDDDDDDLSDDKMENNEKVSSNKYYEFEYFSDFCKYDIEMYFKSFTIIDAYNEFYELFFVYKKLKQYFIYLKRIENYMSTHTDIIIPNNYPVLLDEIGLEFDILNKLKSAFNIKSIKGFLSLTTEDINNLSYVKKIVKEMIIEKQNDLVSKYDTIYFDLITEEFEEDYFKKTYEKSIWSLSCSRKIMLVLFKNNIFSTGQLKKLDNDKIKQLKGVTSSIVKQIIEIKKELDYE